MSQVVGNKSPGAPFPAAAQVTGRPAVALAGGDSVGAGGGEGVGEPPRSVNWWRSPSLGLVLSVVIHAALTGIAAVVTVGSLTGGLARGSGGGDFDLTTTAPAQLTGVSDGPPLEAIAPDVSSAQVPELQTDGILEGAGGVDSPGAGAGLGTIADGLGGAGGGDVGDGKGLGSTGAGSGGASFFGVEAKGSRFLYICDISGSMNWDEAGAANGKRMRILKRELSESISGLTDHMSFYAIFFSSEATPISENRKWLAANDAGKKWAIDRVQGLTPFGGTEPWPAFQMAFTQMRPMPDAIYFMTDGQFSDDVAANIQSVNVGNRKIPIHCITLVEKSGEELMRKIAQDSGGTYTHVEGAR